MVLNHEVVLIWVKRNIESYPGRFPKHQVEVGHNCLGFETFVDFTTITRASGEEREIPREVICNVRSEEVAVGGHNHG